MADGAKRGPGGARPGAGRKPKADKYRPQINRAEKRIVDKLPQLVDRMLDLANGIMVEDTNDLTGETKVYLRAPDRQAGEYLINRIMGRPTERHEVDGDIGGRLHIIIDDGAGGEAESGD